MEDDEEFGFNDSEFNIDEFWVKVMFNELEEEDVLKKLDMSYFFLIFDEGLEELSFFVVKELFNNWDEIIVCLK